MIFVVEDDHGVRELELYALRQSGYEAEGFETPAAFRQALENSAKKRRISCSPSCAA